MDAAMGIRTPVASVRGSHDWPDYTIAAMYNCSHTWVLLLLKYVCYSSFLAHPASFPGKFS